MKKGNSSVNLILRSIINSNLHESLSLWTLHLTKHIFVDCEIFDIYFTDARYVYLEHFISIMTEKYIKLESSNSQFHTSHRKLLGSIISGIFKSQYGSNIILKDSRVITICEPILRRMRQDSYWKLRLMCFTMLTRNFDTGSKKANKSDFLSGIDFINPN